MSTVAKWARTDFAREEIVPFMTSPSLHRVTIDSLTGHGVCLLVMINKPRKFDCPNWTVESAVTE